MDFVESEDALREWEKKHEIDLSQRQKEEEQKRAETRKTAAEELAKWNEDRRMEIAVRKKKLLEVQGKENLPGGDNLFDDDLSDDGKNENVWARVCELVDLVESSDSTRDTSFMKQLLLSLKDDDRAPGKVLGVVSGRS